MSYSVPKKFELKVKNWIRFQYVQQKKDLQAIKVGKVRKFP